MAPLINTISRAEATQRVKNWLEYSKIKFGLKLDEVPKAIYISRADIEDALYEFEEFDEFNREASGVRIYFTKKFPIDDDRDDLRITCVIVPTVMSDKKSKETGRPIHNDAIIKIRGNSTTRTARALVADGGEDGDTETIYDFTSPCPADCEGTTDWLKELKT